VSVDIKEVESMAISKGIAPYCDQGMLDYLRLIKSDQVNNLSYETIREILQEELA
jgi:hypothetical protein